MGLGLLLVPALAGYIFLSRFNGMRYSLPRESGYHAVFQSAFIGILLFFAARLLVWLANAATPAIAQVWKAIVPLDYSGTAAVALVIAFVLPRILNRLSRFDANEAQKKAAKDAGDWTSLIVDQAISQRRLVEFSLTSGKSYVGWPLQGTFGHRDEGDVVIAPCASGYRRKETRTLAITTYYAPAISKYSLGTDRLDDLRVSFPMRDVVSARLFDPELYALFRRDRHGESAGND